MISPLQMISPHKVISLFCETSVASVLLFIALYEKIHFCKGETIELFLIVFLGPINVLNMHEVLLYCLLCSKTYTVPQPTVQLHILYFFYFKKKVTYTVQDNYS